MVDPCAGDGEAVTQFSRLVLGDHWKHHTLYGCEMEVSRFRRLNARRNEGGTHREARIEVVHGDAFAAEWAFEQEGRSGYGKTGASLAYVNAPYSDGTLEARFLDRFTDTLRTGGVLIDLLPYYSLAKSAEIVATHYNVIACFKFPEPLFSQIKDRAFKQVVLIAVRRDPLMAPDPRVVARLTAWGANPDSIPVLPAAGSVASIVEVPSRSGFHVWRMRPVDADSLLSRFVPFHYTDRTGTMRPIPGVVPPDDAGELLRRRYPVTSPLKPAHIATAIAAGVFNGARIVADDPESGWPDLLVKGVFDREFIEIEEKTNKDGEKTGSVKVQQPKLRVTVLDLKTKRYHTLLDSDEETDATTVDKLTTADLLAIYGGALLKVMMENCPPLHDPSNPAHEIPIAEVARPLYKAQAHAVMAAVKLLGGVTLPSKPKRRRGGWLAAAWKKLRRGKAAVFLGEVGSGKTACALATAKTLAAPTLAAGGTYRVLVFCPPHLLKSWRDQAAAVVPEARVRFLETLADVDAEAADARPGLVICVLSRETAKLGHAWDGIGHRRHVANVVPRGGYGFTPSRLARAFGGSFRFHVRAVDPGTEVWAGIEVSNDGVDWQSAGVFEPTEEPGDQERFVHLGGARFVRIAYSVAGMPTATGEEPRATFGVVEDADQEAWCPRCGDAPTRRQKPGVTPRAALAMAHARCANKLHVSTGILGRAARLIASCLFTAFPHESSVRNMLTGRHENRLLQRATFRLPDPSTLKTQKAADAAAPALLAAWQAVRGRHELRVALNLIVRARCTKRVADEYRTRDPLDKAVEAMCVGLDNPELTAGVAVELYGCRVSRGDATCYGAGSGLRDLARRLLLLLPPGEIATRTEAEVRAIGLDDKPPAASYYDRQPTAWQTWEGQRDNLGRGMTVQWSSRPVAKRTTGPGYMWNNIAMGDGAALVAALDTVIPLSGYAAAMELAPACGEPLYEAVADPKRGGRRYALAKYIVRRHRALFDLLVQDESHELGASENSAQSRAGYRLANLGMPVLDLTGSAMGGYAEALFNRQIALDPDFRDEFARDQRRAFVERYGYVKIQERDVDRDTGHVVAYGTVSDRVERETRVLGNAPGVLPLFLLRYLLRIAVVLHKADLKLELPPCREIPITIEASAELSKQYTDLQKALTDQIKADRHDPVRAGKLWGAAAHLPDYPDLATRDTGNVATGVWRGCYEIRYPNNPDLGAAAGEVIHRADPFDPSEVLPKEQWMIDTVKAELAEGRRCLVLGTSVELLPRLRRLLMKALGETVVHLEAKKVPTEQREQWINDNVVAPGVRVMVVNPVAIQTGLNPLVHFCTEIWMQNPNTNAIVFRQAVGRVDRIGQKADETRIYIPTYSLPACEAAISLLMHKVSVSLATDGLDASGALAAAGVGGEEGRFDGFAVGKMIVEIMNGERVFKSRKHAAAKRTRRADTTRKRATPTPNAGRTVVAAQ